MLTGVHLLLSYQCTLACDHCFVYGSPRATGTFTAAQIRDVLDQSVALGTVDTIYFEGGEPFLYHPVLLRGVEMAVARGFAAGVVTNGYWATSDEDARIWLEPLAALGVTDLCVSDDAYHGGGGGDGPAARAVRAAGVLGIPVGTIAVGPAEAVVEDGDSIVRGGPHLRGRAADLLAGDLPRFDCSGFTECPHEDLRDPGRVHVDAFGHVHLCQGLSMGNLWEVPLPQLVAAYDPDTHPIAGPLLRGGPAALAAEHGLAEEAGYVEACHACFTLRRTLVDRFPHLLAPPQAYGES